MSESKMLSDVFSSVLGNIRPQGADYLNATTKAGDVREKLNNSLPEELKKEFGEFSNLRDDCSMMEQQAVFCSAFRLAFEIFNDGQTQRRAG